MDKCPIFQITGILGKKWTIVLMQEIVLNGEKGFNYILKRMRKISPKILSKRLKELEETGIVEREIGRQMPLRTRYRLTQKGMELKGIADSLRIWNERHYDKKIECARKECINCGFY